MSFAFLSCLSVHWRHHSRRDQDIGISHEHRNERNTYDEAAPPDLGAPVSPSPILGAMAENERFPTRRLAEATGRAMLWRNILLSLYLADECSCRGIYLWNKVRGKMLSECLGQPDARGYDDNAGCHVIAMSQRSSERWHAINIVTGYRLWQEILGGYRNCAFDSGILQCKERHRWYCVLYGLWDYELCMSPDCSIAPVERLVRVRYGLAAFENGHGYSIIILARVKIKAAIEQAG